MGTETQSIETIHLTEDAMGQLRSTATLVNNTFVLKDVGKFQHEQRTESLSCAGREVLIRVIATGLCGSDIHYWKHGRIGQYVVEKEIVLGHESAGIVEACGPDVKDLCVGDRIAMEPGISCTTCEPCRAGKYNLCEAMEFAATPPFDGTLATYYRLPRECCFKLPESVSFEVGALVEPLAVAVHCCKLANINPSKSLAVFGAGPIGLLCCAVAKAYGASRIIIADIVKSRLAFAQETFQVHAYHIGEEGIDGFEKSLFLEKFNAADGADVVIDATGVESCIFKGIDVLKRGGTFIQAGLGRSEINFPVGLVCSKEAVFKGSFRYGPGDYQLAIDLLGSGKVVVDKLITGFYPFVEAEQAFIDVSQQKGIKSIIMGDGVPVPKLSV